jgi:hypothetical protein
MPTTPVSTPDAGGTAVARFFSPERFAALRHAAEMIVPGAGEAAAAEFLDFLLSQSPRERVTLYQEGLDRLQAAARQRYRKGFGEISAAEAAPILAPLTQAWTYHPPKDPLARFLREFKEDVLTATVNSREFITAQAQGRRSGGGIGQYWLPSE